MGCVYLTRSRGRAISISTIDGFMGDLLSGLAYTRAAGRDPQPSPARARATAGDGTNTTIARPSAPNSGSQRWLPRR